MTPDDKAEWLAERAAIREYDGKQQRAEAEAGAREDWERTYGADMPLGGTQTRQERAET